MRSLAWFFFGVATTCGSIGLVEMGLWGRSDAQFKLYVGGVVFLLGLLFLVMARREETQQGFKDAVLGLVRTKEKIRCEFKEK